MSRPPIYLVLAISCALVLSGAPGCVHRAADRMGRGALRSLRPEWGAVVVTFTDHVRWEREEDRGPIGDADISEAAERARRSWEASITDRLIERGFKLYPAELTAAIPTPRREISAARFAGLASGAVVLETTDRGRPGPQNGGGTLFLTNPMIPLPLETVGRRIERPAAYDLAAYADRGIRWVILLDLTELVLVRQPGGGTRAGYALAHVTALDLREYRVLLFARIEKPERDRGDWIFGPEIRETSVLQLRRGQTDRLVRALEGAAGRVPDLVERRLGQINAEQYAERERAWRREPPAADE